MERRKAGRNRKGVSELVATVLLIVFVASVVVLAITWIRGMVTNEQKRGETLSKEVASCADINMKVYDVVMKPAQNLTTLSVRNRGQDSFKVTRIELVGSGDAFTLYETNDGEIPAGGTVDFVVPGAEAFGSSCELYEKIEVSTDCAKITEEYTEAVTCQK